MYVILRLKWKTKDKKTKLQYNTRQNIERFTYCSPQTSHTIRNTYSVIIKTQLCLEMRTNLFAISLDHKSTCTARWQKQLKDTEYRCLLWSTTKTIPTRNFTNPKLDDSSVKISYFFEVDKYAFGET